MNDDVITDYQKWKQQGENLRVQAKHAMETQFRELLVEAVRIAELYRADFGSPLKPPPQVTAFRFKAAVKAKGKPAKKAAAPVAAPQAAPPAKPDPKLVALQKKLATAKKKLDDAKVAGTATRVLEDKVYEIEDAIRLATAP